MLELDRPLPPHRCPYCRRTLTVGQSQGPSKSPTPSPGDVALCGHCGGISFHTKTGKLEKASLGDLMNLPTETRHQVYVAASIIRSAQQDRRRLRDFRLHLKRK